MKIPLASFAAILRRLDTLERRVDALANPDRHDGDDAQDDGAQEDESDFATYRPRPSCMGCGKPAVMLTDRLCAPCFDVAWDAQIDAEADRLAGPKVVATS